MKKLIYSNQFSIYLLLTLVFINGTTNAQIKSMQAVKNSMQKNLFKPKILKDIPFLNYAIKSKKVEQTTVANTDCPGTTTTCTVTRANLEAPIFGTSLFTLPTDLFIGNLFDINEYKNTGVMNPKIMGARNKISVSASSQAFGGSDVEIIDPKKNEYMSFLGRARTQLDSLIGDNRPILSAEYNIESITSKDQMKATLGATYTDPQNFFNFSSSVSASSSKQYAILKFVEKSFDVAMDDPSEGLFVNPTTISSSFGFVSNIAYGRFVLLIFETSRNDFDLKATLEGGLNVPGASAGVNGSLALSTVKDEIKVRLVIQGFNANASYSSLLTGTTMDNSIINKINRIIGGAIGTRVASIPIVITAKKATLENFSYPEVSQTVTFTNVPVEKSCVINYPPSATKYKYEVCFSKIYSTKAGWALDEQLYGKLNCIKNIADKDGKTILETLNLISLSKPNKIQIDKVKKYELNSLIKNLKPKIIVFTKPECISEKDFLEKSSITMSADFITDKWPSEDEAFEKDDKFKSHFLNSITTQIGPYENFTNSCNNDNMGIICATTPDGQNFQISYSIKKLSN